MRTLKTLAVCIAITLASLYAVAWLLRPPRPLEPGTEVVLVGDRPNQVYILVIYPHEPGEETMMGYAKPGDRGVVLEDDGGGLNVHVRLNGWPGPVSVLPKNVARVH